MKRLKGTSLLPGFAVGLLWAGMPPKETELPLIYLADSLSTEDALALSAPLYAGAVTRHGSPNGHAAAALRCAGIAWLAGIAIDSAWHGHTCVLYADGTFVPDPTQEELKQATAYFSEMKRAAEENAAICTQADESLELLATVNEISQAAAAIQSGAMGIGLFRSEGLISGNIPDEEQQYWAYRALLSQASGHPVTVRAMDLGGDKQPICGLESNLRGTALLLAHKDWLRTQLRALLRASAHGCLRICYPFVNVPNELQACKNLLRECQQALLSEGKSVGTICQGVMLETPTAVQNSAALAREADFLCIGSADLTQYTLCAARTDESALTRYDPTHPEVMQLVASAVETANRAGCPVTLCGPLAERPAAVSAVLTLGVRSLSVSAAYVSTMRAALKAVLKG